MRLRNRLILAILPLVALTSTLAGGFLLGGAGAAVRRLYLDKLDLEATAILGQMAYENSVVERLGLASSEFYLQSAQRKVLEYLRGRPAGETRIEIVDAAGRIAFSPLQEAGSMAFVRWDEDSVDSAGPGMIARTGEGFSRLGYVRRFKPWGWTLLVSVPSSLPWREAGGAYLPALLVLGAGVVIAGIVASILARSLSLPVEQLVEATERMGAGDLKVRADATRSGEIGQLALSFNAMAGRLEAASAGLEETVRRRTEELSRTIAELERAQDELVRQEKLAALGSLVAGVAHEVNTPLGVSVTASSYIHERSQELRRSYEGGSLGKAALADYLATVEESSAAISANLSRARAILASFKELAVDQQSDERRSFDLGAYLHDILETLRPAAKHRPVAIELEAPAGIHVDGRPAALTQVVANLVMNSLRHAFPDGRRGLIRIGVRREGELIRMEFSDDGVGMDAETAARAFEPFFTTRRGEGGSGLGLAIVETAVRRALGGDIELETAPEAGVRFHISFPSVAPIQAEAEAPPGCG
jgi:signal transduction histidine kinase